MFIYNILTFEYYLLNKKYILKNFSCECFFYIESFYRQITILLLIMIFRSGPSVSPSSSEKDHQLINGKICAAVCKR